MRTSTGLRAVNNKLARKPPGTGPENVKEVKLAMIRYNKLPRRQKGSAKVSEALPTATRKVDLIMALY